MYDAEAAQIAFVLNGFEFWDYDDCDGAGVQCGIQVAIVKVLGGFQWKATWLDRSETPPGQPFPTQRDAKRDLRDFLGRRRRMLLDRAMPPARVDFSPM
jgi:hypothetical protein